MSLDHVKRIDPDRSPMEGGPALAVEVVSPADSAQDMRKKISLYLAAGAQVVWVVYPTMQLVEVHRSSGTQKLTAPDALVDAHLFGGFEFSMSLSEIFHDSSQQRSLHPSRQSLIFSVAPRRTNHEITLCCRAACARGRANRARR